MSPESFFDKNKAFSPEPVLNKEPVSNKKPTRIEPIAFYVLLATVVLAPLAFLPTPYIIIDVVKTALISLGTIISAILFGIIAYKEKSITLPPRRVTWTSVVVGISLIVSSFTSFHLSKSFFGQGFELTTASFLLVLFLAALVVFTATYRKIERIPVIYLGMAIPFIILALLHGARLLIGPSFVSLGVLSGVTTTIFGTWYDLAMYAIMVAIVSISALMFLQLSNRIRIIYWTLLAVTFIAAFIINNFLAWMIGSLVLLALAITSSLIRSRPQVGGLSGLLRRIAWLPAILFIVALVFALWGTPLSKPVIEKFNASYSVLVLPWQLTLDVDSDVLKNDLLFGVGPNHFSKAYLAYKPAVINTTYAWNTEFNQAFSLFGTFIATQGVVGLVSWTIFLVMLGILFVRALRRLPAESNARFAVVSSSFAAFFMWLISMFTVPSHVSLFYAYIFTAIAVAAIARHGIAEPLSIAPRVERYRGILSIVLIVSVVVGMLWGIVYIKDSIALVYFGQGVKALTLGNDAKLADIAFAKANSFNNSDVYLQARAEAGLAQANKLIATIRPETPASTSAQIIGEVSEIINRSIKYSQQAVLFDPANYYNFASEARISELAAGIRMDKAYENAVYSYAEAIKRNPLNPALYLNLAKFQASQNKLDDALKTIGATLQIKNNYLDAIFLLSQVSAAQGNLKDAIIAARVATELNPQSPILFFQLGLLHYNNKDYAEAVKALETAVKLQPDYANAKYFLGLSYTRLNDISNAIDQFTKLAEANPDNQEVLFILNNLREGKSPFADAKPPVTPTPEKRSTLPIKEKKK